MAIQYSLTHRTNAMSTLNTDIGASCIIKLFTGSPPANCATADSGTLLVAFIGNSAGFGVASNGVLTASAIGNAVASNTGTVGYFRIYPSSATPTNAVVQGTCGTSGTDMIISNTTINTGQTCAINSISITAYGA